MSVSVVVPSLRGGDRLVNLVECLASPAVEFVVADNGLSVETRLRAESAGARVVRMGENAGFGRAVNRAARVSEGDVLVIANDDIVPCDGFLTALVGALASAEQAAGVLIQEQRPDVIESAGVEIDRVLAPYDYLHGQSIARLAEGGLAPPLGPCGGAAAYRRDAFLLVGGFDEGFFAYLEDVDLGLRLRRAGARCELAADARALHAGSSTLGDRSLAKDCMVAESRGYLLRKYGVFHRPLLGAWALTSELGASLRQAGRHRSLAPARARVLGWRQGRQASSGVPRDAASVSLGEGVRRRYGRSRPAVAAESDTQESAGDYVGSV
jgi:GT2 family glycosyltransferase